MRITRYSILALCESSCFIRKTATSNSIAFRGAAGDSVIVIL
jgi:hypothetical protein